MQQQTAVPAGLVQTTFDFQNSAIRRQWQKRKVASPGSISEISFRTINLRAALRSGEINDYAEIREIALELDHDLESWRAGMPEGWKYTSLSLCDTETYTDTLFAGRSHVYPNNWIADAWNSWRALRILVQQLILENEQSGTRPDTTQISRSVSVIRELSVDICVSILSLKDNPRELRDLGPGQHVSNPDHRYPLPDTKAVSRSSNPTEHCSGTNLCS